VTVHTASGAGRAFTTRGLIVEDLVRRRLEAELVGQDALAREWLWHRVWELDRIEEFPIYVLGLVDVALWDLAGRLAGLPVHRLLGYYRESIPAYASTVTYGSVAEYLDVADQCLERGFTAIKLHAWGDARRDAELVGALREHVGDGVDLMYDGSAAFDLPDAVHVGRALAEHGYRWYEEPMREFNVGAHARLATRVQVPLLVGETTDGAHMNTADFITADTATYVRTSAVYKGGITGALRIAHLADAHRMRAEVHGMGAVNRALCMAIPNTTYYEALVWGNPIMTDPCVDAAGNVSASQAPGVDWDGPAVPW
jgi:L-alanine-DL-glutamate epimerase-like enolase superfamily enzyme